MVRYNLASFKRIVGPKVCVGAALAVIVAGLVWHFVSMSAKAGPERITVSCSGNVEPCPGTVPVTITMNSGGPDYVDMTYTATVNGIPISCSPSSNRLYVSKGNPVVDNVTLNCVTGTVAFSAIGTGEVGGDTGGCGAVITCD